MRRILILASLALLLPMVPAAGAASAGALYMTDEAWTTEPGFGGVHRMGFEAGAPATLVDTSFAFIGPAATLDATLRAPFTLELRLEEPCANLRSFHLSKLVPDGSGGWLETGWTEPTAYDCSDGLVHDVALDVGTYQLAAGERLVLKMGYWEDGAPLALRVGDQTRLTYSMDSPAYPTPELPASVLVAAGLAVCVACVPALRRRA